MKAILHRHHTNWYDKFELAGYLLQIIIAGIVMIVLAMMTSQVGAIWKVLF